MSGKKLVIVESPAKAKTIAGYLGDDYVVESSIGHIRDLPNRASEIPEGMKKEPWARLGVDVEHDFEPLYVVDSDKKGKVTELKKLLKNADELLLATDEDREGEAIAWHLLEVLQPKVPVRRMVFHEITRDAIQRALGETREVDQRLVDAQETRRILDRLYGYEVSPVLWKKVMQGLSAAESSRSRSGSSSSVSASGAPSSRRATGTSPVSSILARSKQSSRRSTAGASPRAATSPRTARSSRPISSGWTRLRHASSQPSSSVFPSRCAPPTRSPTRADRLHRS